LLCVTKRNNREDYQPPEPEAGRDANGYVRVCNDVIASRDAALGRFATAPPMERLLRL
jgi:hypothetical protein